MMRILRILAGIVVVLAIAVGAVALAARFSDGPMGPIAGGPFTSGEPYAGAEPDWQFLKDRPTVEFQLLEPARSRTTWILVHDGRIFIPCGYMGSRTGRLWKQWPVEAERDGRALLRVDGRIYPRRLVRIKDGPLIAPVVAEINRKYGAGATPQAVAGNALWLFEMKSQ